MRPFDKSFLKNEVKKEQKKNKHEAEVCFFYQRRN